MQATNIINLLENNGFEVATKLEPVKPFWAAEDYHQKYYVKTCGEPYCHIRKKIFQK